MKRKITLSGSDRSVVSNVEIPILQLNPWYQSKHTTTDYGIFKALKIFEKNAWIFTAYALKSLQIDLDSLFDANNFDDELRFLLGLIFCDENPIVEYSGKIGSKEYIFNITILNFLRDPSAQWLNLVSRRFTQGSNDLFRAYIKLTVLAELGERLESSRHLLTETSHQSLIDLLQKEKVSLEKKIEGLDKNYNSYVQKLKKHAAGILISSVCAITYFTYFGYHALIFMFHSMSRKRETALEHCQTQKAITETQCFEQNGVVISQEEVGVSKYAVCRLRDFIGPVRRFIPVISNTKADTFHEACNVLANRVDDMHPFRQEQVNDLWLNTMLAFSLLILLILGTACVGYLAFDISKGCSHYWPRASFWKKSHLPPTISLTRYLELTEKALPDEIESLLKIKNKENHPTDSSHDNGLHRNILNL